MSSLQVPSSTCVYTIHHSDGLRDAARRGSAKWQEMKTWRSAASMFERSTADDKWLPIFFAAADRSSGLLYVARLDNVDIKRTNVDYTEYSFSKMIPIPSKPPISILRLLDTNEPLSEDFIRPYALCHTPIDLLKVLLST